MRRLAWSVAIVSVAVACGGSVSSNGGGASSSGGSGSSSGSSGTSSGSSGGSCQKVAVDATRACVPGTAAADQSLVIQVDDLQGCLPCFTTVDSCAVVVAGDVITLGMSATQCTPSGDVGCATVCAIPSAKCTIPPLAPGKYKVEIVGESDRAGLVPRELVVASGSSEASCALSVPANGDLDGTKYSTSCSNDDDCRPATFGDRCQPCKCPNAAIANAASDAYDAASRAAASQCSADKKGVVCAACPPAKPRCEIQGNELTGTCKLDMN